MEIKYPDYNNSIVNLISTLLKTYGVENHHPCLPGLEHEELRKYDNIVLLVLDGFGYNLYKKAISLSSLAIAEFEHRILSSVFPPTTTAAVTSMLTGRMPSEHGAIGWTLYFKEFCRFIDFLPHRDSVTGELLDHQKYTTYNMIRHENIFRQLRAENPELTLAYFTPSSIHKSVYTLLNTFPAQIFPFDSTALLLEGVEQCINRHGSRQKQFIYAYSSNPDALEHRCGVYGDDVMLFLQDFDRNLELLLQKIRNTNTCILITADHGLIDINGYHYLNEDEAVFQSIILPAFPEPRFISFFTKEHRRELFPGLMEKYSDKFLLLDRKEFLERALLGPGVRHEKLDEFIGDYLLIATADEAMKSIYQQNGKWEKEFMAHHSGLTASEMEIPLIRINS
ncbi:MAG: alkaline phosphatase family protein [Candidatus Cloacimonetes bacterium]|nr:alkaline phosphatase family protein [Candidatus Cloacimonadota bacterium]